MANSQEKAPLPDPVPIQRVLLQSDKAAAELERSKRGILVPLSRQEFEDRVQRAAQVGDYLKNPPRLVAARYLAKLVDTALEGTAEWKIVNPGNSPGILAVQPFNLALVRAWCDNREAVLGDLDGKDLALLVERAGQNRVVMDWSARSVPAAGGLRFNLETPICALASLELDLPADRAVVVNRDACLLTGPHPGGTNDRKTWRLSFAGKSQLSFEVRRAQGPGLPAPLVLARLQTRQELTPGQLQSDYDFDLDVLHGSVKELRLECAPMLRPHEVTIRGLESWELRPSPGKPALLVIRLREPFQGGPLHLSCLAPLASQNNWTSPGMRLVDAVSRGETLTLRIHPGVLLEDWQPAGFRTTRTLFQADGWQQLSLVAGLDAGVNPARPTARVQTPGPEYQVRQASWWQIAPEQWSLTTQIAYEVSSGRLFSLQVVLPNNWDVEQVEMTPADLLQGWSIVNDKGKPTLMVDLQRPLDPASGARMTLIARPSKLPVIPNAGQAVPIPDFAPAGARVREGALAISVASLYQATPKASVPAQSAENGDEREADSALPPRTPGLGRPPWGKQVPDYYFPFQGQAIEGTLQLRPRLAQLRGRAATDVVIAAGRASAMTRLELRPEIGAPQTVDFFVSSSVPGAWEWKTVRGSNQVVQIQRFDLTQWAPFFRALSARSGLAAVTAIAPIKGSWWRVQLARPLSEPVTIEAGVELVDQGRQDDAPHRWDVPLVTVPAADRFDGQVTLHLAGVNLVHVEATGLLEVVDPARREKEARDTPAATGLSSSGSSSWRTFRYGHPPVALTVQGATPATDRSTEAVVDHASMTTDLGPDGRLLHSFRFQVWNWRQPRLPIRLATTAQLQAVRAGDRWLERLPPAELVDGVNLFELPVVPGTSLHRFEIVYSSELPAWRLWTTLKAPVPSLPLERKIAFRRTWRLPTNVVPLGDGSVARLSTTAEGKNAPIYQRHGPVAADWAVRQEQALMDAVALLRKQHSAGEAWPLGKALERLAFDHIKDQPLILDGRALRNAGLRPSTLLNASAWEPADGGSTLAAPWEAVGLIYVPSQAGPLLTSRRQLVGWQTTVGGNSQLPAGIEEAVAEAVAFGHDRSGRFRTVPDWLQLYDQGEPSAEQAAWTHPMWNPLAAGGTEWEPLPGNPVPTALLVVHSDAALVTGAAVAVLFLLAALRFAPASERRRRLVLLVWLGLFGLAVVWLPAAVRLLAGLPAAAGLFVAVVWELRPLRASLVRVPAPAATALLLLLTVTTLSGQVATPPSPTFVYLVPDGGGDQAKQRVLAPPALLQQLQALERRGVAGLGGAVLLGAAYEGRADNAMASFKAAFQVYSFTEEATTLFIPLAGVNLTDAMLDGASAYPAFQRQPREGFSLRLQGRGVHALVLRFTVPLPGLGDERELRFGIPELPTSRLTLRVPGTKGYLYAAEARGAQHVGTDGALLKLDADLGAVKTLIARWHKEEPQPSAAVVNLKESYYWNLQSSGARLLAVLQYTVTKGWQNTFLIDLPNELEVQSVEAGPLPDGPSAPRLKEWLLRQEGAGRRLVLEFQGPVTHGVQITIEFLPGQPFGRTAKLPFPAPLDAKEDGFFAYRTEGLDARVGQFFAMKGIEKPMVAAPFAEWMAGPWRLARQEDLGEPTRTFWRSKGGWLQLILSPRPLQTRCTSDISWRISPRQAMLRATAKVTAPDASLALVEWELPAALQLIEVTGSQMHHWTRSGPRIQVWLQKPVSEITLQLTGWLPRSPKEQALFNLPALRVLDVHKQSSTVHVAVGDELLLNPGKLQNLVPRPELGAPGREWVYETEHDSYGAVIQTSPAVANVDFRLLTFAEVQDRELNLTATLQCNIRQGELRTLTITLRNWDGGEVTLTAPDISRRLDKRLGPGARSWVLDLKPGIQRHYQLSLSGKIPLGAAPAIFLPDMRVETAGGGAIRLDRWVAVAGADLAAEGVTGLSVVPDAINNKDLESWPREANRLRRAGGTVWKVSADDWRLRLRPQIPVPRTGAVQVFQTKYGASVTDQATWLHQATYWLYHEAGADLSFLMPAGATVLGVAVDGVSMPPLQAGEDRLWLPLPGGAGVRRVRICWTFAEGIEPIEAPILAGPRLEGVNESSALWVVAVPPGYQGGRRSTAGKKTAEHATPLTAAGLDLAQAEAQLRLLAFLVDRSRESGDNTQGLALVAAQQQVERSCRCADYQLTHSHMPAGTGPDGQSLATWLQEVRDKDTELTRTPIFARLSAEVKQRGAARSAEEADTIALGPPLWRVSPFEQGRPLYWQSSTPTAVPLFRLVPEESVRSRQALTTSTLLAVILLASWILWRAFQGAAWPEQLALLGAFGALLFGMAWGSAFLVLPGIWLGVRLVQLGHWGQSRWPWKPKPADAQKSSIISSQAAAPG
jgi:hypothetical protein